MRNRSFAFTLLLFMSFSVVASMASVHAGPLSFVTDSTLIQIFTGDIKDTSVVAEYVKWFFLVLVIFLIYAGLSYADFPDNVAIRWGMSLVVGLLATLLLTKEELLAAMLSYSALGVSIILFFPILALGFITFAVSLKVAPFGILLQRVLWVIYSVYLFIQTLGFLIIRWVYTPDYALVGPMEPSAIDPLMNFIFGPEFIKRASESGSSTILIVLLVVSVVVFFIFVVKNQGLVAWISKEMREADIQRFKDTAERAKMARGIEADLTRSGKS